MNEIQAALENCPKLLLNLNQKTQLHFEKSLLCHFEMQAKKQLKEIENDPNLTEKEKEQAMDACEAQFNHRFANLDQERLECIELLGDSFSFAAASDASFAALNIKAQQFLFHYGIEMLTTMRERFPFLKERQYYPELMERIEKRLHSMELQWNPFPLLGDDILLNIASYLPSRDLQRWTVSHRFLHEYFNEVLFCETITPCASSRDYQEALDRQHAYLKEICKGPRDAWACQMGGRIKGLSLKKFTAEKIDLDQLLEKCPNLIALDLRGANITPADLPFNIHQLKFLVLPDGLLLKDTLLSSLGSIGFKQSAEDPRILMRGPVVVESKELIIDITHGPFFNPISLLNPSIEKLSLKGDWKSPQLNDFFSQLKDLCPNLQDLDAENTLNIMSRLFYLDLTWIKKLRLCESPLQTDFFPLLSLCGLVMTSKSFEDRYPLYGIRLYYVWERADFIPTNTLDLKSCDHLTERHWEALSQLYPRLNKLRIRHEFSVLKVPAIWKLISASTEIEFLHSYYFPDLQDELEKLGFLSKKDSKSYKSGLDIINWTNPRGYFTYKGINLDRFDQILTMSPKSATSKIGLPSLDLSPLSNQFEELRQLKELSAKHGMTLHIDHIQVEGECINELPALFATSQIAVTKAEIRSLSENMELSDIRAFLQQQKVEKLQLSRCSDPSKANQLLRTVIDHCEEFPDLVEIAGPHEGIVPETWILKGWFPSFQGNIIKISRRPTDVTLSTQVAETLTEQALLNLLTCQHLERLDLRGQPVTEQLASKLLAGSLKKFLVSPEIEEKIFFVKMLSAVEPGIVFRKYGNWETVDYLEIPPMQGRQIVVTDNDILAMIERFPSLGYLRLENADLSQITAAGIRALLKLKLKEVALGASSLQLINALLNINTLSLLQLHTEKLQDLDFAQFTCRMRSKETRKMTIHVSKFHSICLLLLQHPAVDHIKFENSSEPSTEEKKAMTELGIKLEKSGAGFYSSRINQRNLDRGQLIFNGRHFSLTVRDTLVCSNKDLNDQGLLLLPSTKSLTLKNTPAVTFNGLIVYLQNSPSLQTFRIYKNISSEQVSQLKSIGWQMTAKNRMYQEFKRV